MTHQIVKIFHGKTEVVAEGSLAKMNRRLKQLRASTRNSGRGRSQRGGVYQYLLKKL